MNELKYIESFSKEEIIEKMQNYLNEVEADIENPRSDADDAFVASIKKEVWLVAIQLAKQIEEPQKVKVPDFVSREIVYYRAKGFSNSQIIEDAYNSNVPNQFTKWYWTGSNKDLFFDAVAYGCIVEKV